MKLHSCLVVIEKPNEADHEKWKLWQVFQTGMQQNQWSAKEIEKLDENIFLIPLRSTMRFQIECLFLAQKCKVNYRVLFFEEAPQWILSDAEKK